MINKLQIIHFRDSVITISTNYSIKSNDSIYRTRQVCFYRDLDGLADKSSFSPVRLIKQCKQGLSSTHSKRNKLFD